MVLRKPFSTCWQLTHLRAGCLAGCKCQLLVAVVVSLLMSGLQVGLRAEENREVMRELAVFASPVAHQAASVDAAHFYAIANREVIKYDKRSGEQVAHWQASGNSSIKHLNSGVIVEGSLYCAHSNWPATPLKNSIEVWNVETLEHQQSIPVADLEGALTWVDFQQGHWWLAEAFYGPVESVQRSTVRKCDAQWNVLARYTLPPSVIERLVPFSNSGGSWGPDGLLYLTGHDRSELYVTRLPKGETGELLQVRTVPAPVAGQGIAWDRWDIGTMYGIRRSEKKVVVSRQSHRDEFTGLELHWKWRRDPANPVLPPRTGTSSFDSNRCMNPWVRRVGQQYHLYYSGGDATGKQRIGVAVSQVGEAGPWRREGPLLEPGPAGDFDARWCVLPHVVESASAAPATNSRSPRTGKEAGGNEAGGREAGGLWMYYTGHAGRGEGLSAFPGIGLATAGVERATASPRNWRKHPANPVLAPSGEPGSADAIGIAGGSVIRVRDERGQRQWRFYYTGCPTTGQPLHLNQQKTICLAVSRNGVAWEKRGAVLLRDPGRDYEDIGVAGPVVQSTEDGGYRMWYSAIGTRWGYYSICYAESEDGIHWRRGAAAEENLHLTPAGNGWERQMVEYPAVIREGDRFRMFYCGNGYGRTGIGTATAKPD